jgi:hypothetical protein
MRDGLAGTAAVNVPTPTAGATSLAIDTIALNTIVATTVPVGARFRIAGETGTPIHTVTAVTGSGPTTAVTFTPVTAAGVLDNAVITFLPQQIEIKVGDGNLTYTEARELTYELDRGTLDTVRQGDDQPLAVSLQFVYEQVKTGTGEKITPIDAVKGIGGAAGWVSSSSDPCEVFAIDLVIEYTPVCSGTPVQGSTTVFPDFRYDSLQYDLSAAAISVEGRCNATEANVTRT